MQKYNKTMAQILQELELGPRTPDPEFRQKMDDLKRKKEKISKEVERLGLTHLGRGVYGKNGKASHRSDGNQLNKMDPKDIEDYEKNKSGDASGKDEPKKDSPDTDKPKQDSPPSSSAVSRAQDTSPRTPSGQLLNHSPHENLPDKEQIGTDMRTVMGDRQPKVSYTQNGETIIHFKLKPFRYGPNEMAYDDIMAILEDEYGLEEGKDFILDEKSEEIDGEDMPSEIMVNIRRNFDSSDSEEDEEAYDAERSQLARRGLFPESYSPVNEATVSVFDISYDDVPKSKLTQAARKFKIKMKKLPKNKVSFGGDDAIEFTGDEKNLLKFTKQQFGTTARNIRDLKKELEETAYPQITHSLIESVRNVVSEDPVQKAQDRLDKAKKIADLQKQIQTVRSEEDDIDEITMGALSLKKLPTLRGTITDKQIQNLKKVWAKKSKRDVTPSLKKMLKNLDAPTRAALANANINVISKLVPEEALDDKDVDTIKPIIKQLKKSVKAHDKQAKQLTKDIQDDVNEATVTIKSYDTKTGLDRQAEKQMNAVATRAGAKVKKSGNNVYKISGDGKQLSKFMANIDQIDGSFMTEESEFMNEFTSSQIKRLKKEYEPLRGVHHTELQPARFTQLSKMMQRMGKPQLQALVKADIPVLSSAAKASLVVNHGMKFSSIKEELIPYLEVFPLDEKKSKFTSIEPKVIDRIEKMMRGSRAEKDSIANMLNFMMPPEVVDMVRYKLKIVPKRGKIKF